LAQWPGCVGLEAIAPPWGMHWDGGSPARFSTALTNRERERLHPEHVSAIGRESKWLWPKRRSHFS
jgi:hypothetical protein